MRGALGEAGHVVVRGVGVRGEGLELAVLARDRVVGGVEGVVWVGHSPPSLVEVDPGLGLGLDLVPLPGRQGDVGVSEAGHQALGERRALTDHLALQVQLTVLVESGQGGAVAHVVLHHVGLVTAHHAAVRHALVDGDDAGVGGGGSDDGGVGPRGAGLADPAGAVTGHVGEGAGHSPAGAGEALVGLALLYVRERGGEVTTVVPKTALTRTCRTSSRDAGLVTVAAAELGAEVGVFPHLHVLAVVDVQLAGQKVPVGGPRHLLLHLALGIVKYCLVSSGLGRDLVGDHFPSLLSDGDKFTSQKFLIDHFDYLVNLLRLIGRKSLQTLASKPEVEKLSDIFSLHIGLVELHPVRVCQEVVKVLGPLEVGRAGVGRVGLAEGRSHVCTSLRLKAPGTASL